MTRHTNSANVLPEIFKLELDSVDGSPKPLLSPQQQLALMSLVKVDDPVAKQHVIAHNLHLVVNIAKRYSNRGVALMDLVSEGTMGLIHALENFELEGGFRFATYAAQCVRQSIERTIMNQPLAAMNSY